MWINDEKIEEKNEISINAGQLRLVGISNIHDFK